MVTCDQGITAGSPMVGTPIVLVQRPISPGLIKDLYNKIMPLRPKTSEMAKEQERKEELPGIKRRGIGLPCQCSATKLVHVGAVVIGSCFCLVILLGILLLTVSRHIIYIILYNYTYIVKNVIDI